MGGSSSFGGVIQFGGVIEFGGGSPSLGGVIQFGGCHPMWGWRRSPGDGGSVPAPTEPIWDPPPPPRFCSPPNRTPLQIPPPPTAPSPFSDRSVLLSGLRAALEALGVPCYLGGAARGLLPPESPLLLRHNRRDALRDADLVLLAGASPGSGRHRDAPRCPRVPTSHPPPPFPPSPPKAPSAISASPTGGSSVAGPPSSPSTGTGRSSCATPMSFGSRGWPCKVTARSPVPPLLAMG